MNAKKAKALRKDAKAFSQGLPNKTHAKEPNGSDIVHPSSTRGLYRLLKKEHRKRGTD